MMAEYFIGALLPELQMDAEPEIGFDELMAFLNLNLSKNDLAKVAVIRRIFDIYNVKSSFSHKGNLDEVEFEEALITKEGLPDYFADFIEKYNNKERQKHFGELLSRYFKEEIHQSTGFIRSFLKMEKNSRLVLAALRAKKLKRDIVHELQYEDAEDDLVASILAQKDAPVFDPPEEVADLKALYEEHSASPLDLQKALWEWKFHKIQEMEGIDSFSLDKILGYTARLILVEKALAMDENKGNALVDGILRQEV